MTNFQAHSILSRKSGLAAAAAAVARVTACGVLVTLLPSLMGCCADGDRSLDPTIGSHAIAPAARQSRYRGEGAIVEYGGSEGDAAVTGPARGMAPARHSSRLPTASYEHLKLNFEPNKGQTHPRVKYLSRGPGYTLFLTSSEAVLLLAGGQAESKAPGQTPARKHDHLQSRRDVLRMKLLGARGAHPLRGLQKLPGRSNYFIGNDPKRWYTDVPYYAQVVYEDVYPGINLVFYGHQGQLEYDFVVAPGARVEAIRMAFKGADELALDDEGNLIVRLAAGQVVQRAPLVYQNRDGLRQTVGGRYVLNGKNEIAFEVGPYDPEITLVIDPVLSYSTYLGGSGDEISAGIAADADGNAYIAGRTPSVDFPVLGAPTGSTDVFVVKLDDAGGSIVWATYIGGTGSERAEAMAFDDARNSYVSGFTTSTDFPTPAPGPGTPFDTTFNGGFDDAFVVKLRPNGSLLYGTYLGGSGGLGESATGLAVDGNGDIYIGGATNSCDFPVTPGAYDTTLEVTSRFAGYVAKLSPDGNGPNDRIYATFLHGNGVDFPQSLAIDSAGDVYLGGNTTSDDFPTTTGAYQTTFNHPGVFDSDGFVTKLRPAGQGPNDLLYSTYLGGATPDAFGIASDSVFGIASHESGDVFLTGFTHASDFPTTTGSFDETHNGRSDVFVARLRPAGQGLNDLIASTFLGGTSREQHSQIRLDAADNVFVAGQTKSANFPVTGDASQPTKAGSHDAFLALLDPNLSALTYSTFLGGTGFDFASDLALGGCGGVYLVGETLSPIDFNTLNPLQPASGGGFDLFVAKFTFFADTDTDADGIADCVDSDDDNDGILDEVDVQPLVISTAFSDVPLGGVTSGEVIGGLVGGEIPGGVVISDATNPNRGIKVEVPGTVVLVFNFDCASYSAMTQGPSVTVFTCGSLRIDAISGSATATFTIDGVEHEVVVDEGGTATLEETLSPSGELETITVTPAGTEGTVTVDGQTVVVGQSISVLSVEIDIKPGSFQNRINLGSRGTVPVAIFSNATFDATTIDPLTVSLAGATVRLRGQGRPQASFDDVNGDGLLDLLVHVQTEELELSETDAETNLTASADANADGVADTIIRGRDTVRVVP